MPPSAPTAPLAICWQLCQTWDQFPEISPATKLTTPCTIWAIELITWLTDATIPEMNGAIAAKAGSSVLTKNWTTCPIT